VQRDLPSGSVTFLFTDIEGSTKLLHELGPGRYAAALEKHRLFLRKAFNAHGGVEVDTQGDAFFVAFSTARGALAAAQEANGALAEGPIRVRMGIHTGTPHVTGEGYVGEDVHLGARIAAAAHGGQVLLSRATRELVDGEISDLGEHRLKDFTEPVWLFQLGLERFPPLKTISNTNLPRSASSFVGREKEVKEVASLLQDGARLLTLTGPGGSGKTRLAIEAAAELVPEFRNGVFWVGLATLREPALVIDTIAQMLGTKDGLAEYIGERELLLLLDNLEQVVEAAPELAAVVETCPNLRLLVTSREPLRVRGEVEYPVLPLAEPEAVELFCARARAEQDETIAELCRRLDNLPLALELAAARTNVLSPPQILDRISHRLDLLKGGRDADPRQQTLRATIEWSYDLLDEKEQRLFARLAVFPGGCTLEAAEQVAEADLDTLQSLVDKSLLRHTGERFWMLETIREYALQRLEPSAEADHLHARHAECFLALAEEAEPYARECSREWLDRLEAEHDNLRAAIEWFAAAGMTEPVQLVVGALSDFWGTRGHIAEGWRRLQSALAADERPTPARAKALGGAAGLALGRGDDAAVRELAGEALALHQSLGDTWGAADSLFLLGHAAADNEEFDAAQELAEESARLFREAGDDHQALQAAWLLGWALRGLGKPERARILDEGTLAEARARGAKHIQAHLVEGLGQQAVGDGRPADALPLFREAYELNLELDDRWRMALVACKLATALIALGQPEGATQVLASGKAQLEEMGADPVWRRDEHERDVANLRGQLGEASFAETWERGRKLTADEAVALALKSLS
jgi:predicted ATPase